MNSEIRKVIDQMEIDSSILHELCQVWKEDQDPVMLATAAYSYGVVNTRKEEQSREKRQNEHMDKESMLNKIIELIADDYTSVRLTYVFAAGIAETHQKKQEG